jgi:hypothetical protein
MCIGFVSCNSEIIYKSFCIKELKRAVFSLILKMDLELYLKFSKKSHFLLRSLQVCRLRPIYTKHAFEISEGQSYFFVGRCRTMFRDTKFRSGVCKYIGRPAAFWISFGWFKNQSRQHCSAMHREKNKNCNHHQRLNHLSSLGFIYLIRFETAKLRPTIMTDPRRLKPLMASVA